MDSDKNKSISRSKKSAVKLVDFLAEEAASVVPGGASAYKVGKHLFNHAKQFITDQREERLEDFHKRILSEGDNNYWEEVKDKEFQIDEYYSLLNFVVQDEEEQKVKFYADLFRLLLLRKLPEEYRDHIIRSARELKYSDIELLRQIYINDKYVFKSPGNKQNQIKELTQPDSPLKKHSIQTLIRFGYLSDKDGNKPPWPTELLKMLVENLFDENQLKA